MSLGVMHLKHFPRPKVPQWGETLVLIDGVDIYEINISYDNAENSQFYVKLPLSDTQFSLQEKDPKIRVLCQKVQGGMYNDFYFIEKDILYRSIIDNGHKCSVAVIPEDLTDTVLFLGPNQSGHNGYQRTYATIKCRYYWKGRGKHILVHCKTCVTCAKQKVQKTQFEKQIFELGVQPMEFVCIDLIGEFHPPSSKGNRCCLHVDRFYILYPYQE